MDQATSVVCICETSEQALRARFTLQEASIDMSTLSSATRDIPAYRNVADYYAIGDQTFNIPGLGFLLVSGPLASWIGTAAANGPSGGGISWIGAGLATLDIPLDSIFQYEAALRSDRHLLVLHGSPKAVATAAQVIGGTTHCSHTVHGEKVFDVVRVANVPETPAYTYQM